MGLEKEAIKILEKNDFEDPFLEEKKIGDLDLYWRHSIRQVIAACIAHSTVIQVGINMAFSAVLLPQLKEINSEIPIDINQESWIGSIGTAFLPLGSLTIGPLMDKFGRKKMCMFTTIPFLVSWVLHNFASTVWHIYLARIFAGFGAGISTVCLVYVSEISHPKYRPMLLTFNSVFVTSGILLTCIFGFGLYWRHMTKIFLVLTVLSLVAILFIPESPYWLVVFKNDKKGCSKALEWIYTDKKVCANQYQTIINSSNTRTEDEDTKSKLQRLKEDLKFYMKPIVWKPLAILLFIFVFQQLSAAYVIIAYAVSIFRKIGGSFEHIGLIDEFVALILLGGIRFTMAIVLAVISKKVHRRTLMLISGIGMTVSSLTLALYMYVTHTVSPTRNEILLVTNNTNHTIKENLESHIGSDGTAAVVLLLSYICFSSFGWLVIPWTLIGELLPVKVRGVLGGVMVSAAYIFMFVILKIAPFLMNSTSLEVIFLCLGVINLCGMAFVYFFLPETLGKTFDDIAKYFDSQNIDYNIKRT